MDTSMLDFNTLTLLVAIVGSTLTIVSSMFRRFNRQEESIKSPDTRVAVLDTKVDALDTKVTALEGKSDALSTRVTALEGKFDALDTKVTAMVGKVDVMGRDVSDSRKRLARVEGHLLAPEGFTLRRPDRREAADPSSDDPAADHREAG